jgi:hypothetical protein
MTARAKLWALTVTAWAVVAGVLYAYADLTTRTGRAMACCLSAAALTGGAVWHGRSIDDLRPRYRRAVHAAMLLVPLAAMATRWAR